MVVRDHPALSLSRQCRLLSVGRSSLYYKPKGESAETLALMRRIDELFLKYPFYGARRMALHLRREGVRIGRRRAARLMSLMGLQAIYRAPRTSDPHPEHRVYPYLLRGLAIERPNHVWCADITYIPVNRGFLYLVAIMDWASRYVLAWRLSNTLDASFCTDTLDEALARHGKPEIVNTDQGSQFTSFAFTGRLQAAGIRISMDGRGRCMDNIFIERLWRSLKYEAIYLHEIADGFQARRLIGDWVRFYNLERPHAALDGRTPAEAYRGEPMRLAPTKRCPDALAELSRDFGLLRPQRSQDGKHVFAANLVNRHFAEPRKGVAFHLLPPIGRDLGAAPARPARLESLLGCFAERGHPCLTLLGKRVAAVPRQAAVLERLVPSFGQTHKRKSAEPDVAALAVDCDSLDPTLGAARCHVQVERRVGPIHAWLLDRPRPRDGEPIHAFPTFFPTFDQGTLGNRTDVSRQI